MAGEPFLKVKTIGRSARGGRKPSTIVQAARHNMRAEQVERGARAHIDPTRSHLNQHLRGPATPGEVAAQAQSIMAAHGVAVDKLRKDYAQALEIVFSLPIDTRIDVLRYFAECVEWAAQRFEDGNILCADIHMDEAAPHCHVLVLPMAGGRWVGGALLARERLAALLKDFYDAVCARHGLKRPERLAGADRARMAAAVLARMNATGDKAMSSQAWEAIRGAIERDPRGFAAVLGVEVAAPARKLRTVAQIFTSKGRGTVDSKPIGFEDGRREVKPIGFEAKKGRNLSCVGFAHSPPPIQPLSAPMGAAAEGVPSPARPDPARPDPARPAPANGLDMTEHEAVTRVRDADMAAGQWSEELGEWVPAPAPGKRRRAAAEAWVAEALSKRRG